jgi:hypothetical protein
MTGITLQLAAAHDRWFDHQSVQNTVPRLQLGWRHFARHHAALVNALEWVGCGLLAITILTAELIANA